VFKKRLKMNLKISLPDGSVREFPEGVKGAEIASSISEGLARNALAIEVNGEVWDLFRPINKDSTVKILTWSDKAGKNAFWHSSAHLLAEALEALYPGVKFGIGPPIENGFYYDVDLGGKSLGENDLAAIESKMKELAKKESVFSRREVSKKEAMDYFSNKKDEYKLELIRDLEDGKITFYQQGNFTDLCRGPHIPHTGVIKAVKLLNVAGAYWRGNENFSEAKRAGGICSSSGRGEEA
jgi:threonyl-tRNA synthetase